MWKPIDTLAHDNERPFSRDSDAVLLYVSQGPYSMYEGPVVGFMSMHFRRDGSLHYRSCTVESVGGYECENDFQAEDVTHWMELPEPPQAVCGHCGGTGWMVRDPDIGTDQECFVCNGSGKLNSAEG